MLYTLEICFAHYKESVMCLILFSKFSDVLLAFACGSAICNLWSICLGVNSLRSFPCFALHLASDSKIISKKTKKKFPHKSKTFWIFSSALIWSADFDFGFPFLFHLDLI